VKKTIDTSEGIETNPASKKKVLGIMRTYTTTDKILLWAAILLFIAGAVILAWSPIQNYLREQKTSVLLEGIEEGNPTLIVDRDALPIPGEGYETFEAPTADPVQTAEETVTLPENVVLTALGTIRIDEIDLFLPLLDSATVVPLRYGAGMLKGTALPGEEGNCVVLGHRMKAYGSLFNRLDEISIGDTIIIKTIDKTEYKYVVDVIIMKLDPSDLEDYIDISSGTGTQLTLITCTPTGVGSHRIIIIAHLQE
jgi:LPXTG-site transpeptidase (sortase) family protein